MILRRSLCLILMLCLPFISSCDEFDEEVNGQWISTYYTEVLTQDITIDLFNSSYSHCCGTVNLYLNGEILAENVYVDSGWTYSVTLNQGYNDLEIHGVSSGNEHISAFIRLSDVKSDFPDLFRWIEEPEYLYERIYIIAD